MALKLEQLRKMSDVKLVREHDAAATNMPDGINEFRDELRHRQLAHQTRTLVWLTVVIAILTAANVVLVAYTLLK